MEPIVKQLFALLGVFIFATSVAGLTVSGAESEIEFYQKPYTYEFEIINESAESFPFDVQLFAPIQINRIEQPSILDGHSTTKIVLQLIPTDDLLDQVIAGTLVVRYGSQETKKEVTFTFQPSVDDEQNGGLPSPIGGLVAFAFNPAVWEVVIDAVLLVIVLILIVALIARMAKRMRK